MVPMARQAPTKPSRQRLRPDHEDRRRLRAEGRRGMTDERTFAQDWAAAGEDDDWVPPDGAYKAKLIDGSAFTGRTNPKNFVKLEWQLLEGDDVGRRFEDFKQISNEVG